MSLLLYPSLAYSQLVINNTQDPSTLVQNVLVGAGITVSNVTFNGAPGNIITEQVGTFNSVAANVGIPAGIILCTGDVAGAVGPNNTGAFSLGGGNLGAGDPDLQLLDPTVLGFNDAAALEFDFIPTGDSVSFNFVFASEEYLEFVNNINDAFGIFLSGPGITGPYSNGSANIALVPGTGQAITIDNVNDVVNPAYYIDNGDGATAPFSTDPFYIQYDGMTTVMTAAEEVICGQSYHIKIVVGDASDDAWDSAVFLEAQSFITTGNDFSIALVPGVQTNFTEIIEGCDQFSIDFLNLGDLTQQQILDLTITGTATAGLDYTPPLPTQIIFAPGQSNFTYTGAAPQDADGNETIIISYQGIDPCTNAITTYTYTYTIVQGAPPPVVDAGPDQILCPGTVVQLNATPVNLPLVSCDYTLVMNDTWGDGWNGCELIITANNIPTIFTLPIGTTQTVTVPVVHGAPIILDYSIGFFNNEVSYELYDASGTLVFADGLNPTAGTVFVGVADCSPLGTPTYSWSPSAGLSSTTIANPVANPSTTTTYYVTMGAMGSNCEAIDSVMIVVPPTIDAGLDATINLCASGATVNLFGQLGGTPDAGGTWSGPSGAFGGTFDPALHPPGVYTYSVQDWPPCPPATATVTVTVSAIVNAGISSSVDLCSTDASVQLFSLLGGTPDAGGTWSGPNGAFSGTLDPAVDPAGVYTYTITAIAPCLDASASVTIGINTPPDPGVDGTITLCSTDAAVQLFTSLGGTPDAGGSWSGPNGASNGVFDPSTDPTGVYTYTVNGTAPCPDENATVIVSVNIPPDPGIDGMLTLCSSDAAVQLIASLGGTPDAGGTWSGPNGAFSGTLDPSSDPAGAYTYTVPGAAPCIDASTTVTVAINVPPDPGLDGTIILCSTDAAAQLIASLGGTPDLGGVWNGPNGAFSGTLDPSSDPAGIYTYTVAGTAPCPDESATVTVTINLPPDPGVDGTITLCSSDAGVQLISSLGGSPDAGGTWSGPNGAFSGTLDPSSDPAGVYTYIVAGTMPCMDASANITVTINTPPDPGLDGSLILCSTDAAVQLFASLGGTPDPGGVWNGPNGAFSGSLDPSSDPAGIYTYTVAGTAPCPDESATITVTLNLPPDPGADGTITLCSSDAAAQLFTSLGGTPDLGGTWSGPNGAFSGTLDPSSDPAGIYTYTVPGAAPCIDANATVTVTINAPPDPGLDGSISLCSSGASVQLLASLGGTPDLGGSWSGPNGASSGTLDPSIDPGGVYTYTLTGTAPCPDETATVSITINTPPDPGVDGMTTLCSSDAAVQLIASLGGTPDPGGSWSGPNGAFSGTLDPSVDPTGIYTYTLTGTAPCPDETATITVVINTPPDPGTDGMITLCSTDAAVQLITSLGGTPVAGGSWTGPGGASNGMFDPSIDAAGIYTYTVVGTAPCPDETATVTVVINTPANAGVDGMITLCSTDAAVQLFTSLGGTPDLGGSWNGPNGATTGALDPSTDPAGVYTYTVAGATPCVDASANITVTINTPPDPGLDGTLTLCSTDAAVQLIASLGGMPNAGGAWVGPSGVSNGILDPSSDPAGVYTYTVPGTAPCPDETASVTVTINTPPDPGLNAAITLCSTDGAVQLFSSLGGSPDAGGYWNGPNGAVSGNLDPSIDPAGVYTHTVTGAAPCPDETASVTVTINTPPAPGLDGTITLCSSDAAIQLFASLGGSPDLGGTWTGPAGASNGILDPSVGPAGSYTYTLTGTSPCPNESATVTVTINTPPNAGSNGAITLCTSDAAAQLIASLGGTPDTGGTWSGPAGPSSGMLDPATDPAGVYTYTVAGNAPCPDASSTVQVTINTPPNPGINGMISLCSTDATVQLFASLGGTPDVGGSWTGPAGASNGSLDPYSDPAGIYTYTVAGLVPCADETATVSVVINTPSDAGQDGSITLCITSPNVNLFTALLGTPSAGGSWTDGSGNAFNGTFIPGTDTPGTFSYTVAGTAPCPDATATVTVVVATTPDAGLPGTIDLCETDAPNVLFSSILGSPDPGGTWTDASGNPFTGTFDPAIDNPGVYTYTITVPPPCVSVNSTVTVAVVAAADAGLDGSVTLCISSPAENIFNSLLGTPAIGGVWTNSAGGAFSGSFIPGTDTPGIFTYTVAGSSPCPDATATVTVVVSTTPDAGFPGSIDLCETDVSSVLFNSILGSPDPGGSWTDASGNPFSGTFDPAVGSPGVYTYTITVPPPCVSVSSTVTVSVVAAADAGLDGSVTLCISSPAENLFNSLLGTPAAGGVWTTSSGGVFAGSFIPGTNTPGIFTYTVAGSSPCPNATATVTVVVATTPDAGLPGTIDLCETDASSVLFNSILGSPDPGGSWTDASGNPFSGTFDPAVDNPGVYTYTITVPPPCVSVSSTVTVGVVAAADAGLDGSVTLCISSPAENLFNSLLGTPAAGGTWTNSAGGAFSGSFIPGTDTPGVFTYTVAGSSPCPDGTATVIVVVATTPDAGLPGTIDLCETDAPSVLFNSIMGSPDPGGSWTDASGNPFSGTFDPAADNPGVYTYTITVPLPCVSVSSTVTVGVITPPDAGQNGAVTLCISSPITALFGSLTGTPNSGGSWTDPSGNPFSGSFDPASDPDGVYVYLVSGTSPCPDQSAAVTVSVVSLPDPGTNGTLNLCATDPVSNLFNSLGGTPDLGGSWTDVNGNAFSGNYDPALDPAGVYSYTISVPPPCVSVTSIVTVSVSTPADPGADASITLCISSPVTNLFSSLGGTPDAGGSWTVPGGGSYSGQFDAANDAPGIYTYTVSGQTPCPAATATVTVNVVSLPDPGTNGALNLCETDPVSDLFYSLGGTPDPGGAWIDASGNPFSGNFDPATDVAGVYTYTITVPLPCLSVSSSVTVTTITPSDAGADASVTLCISSPATNLFAILGGSPDVGGTWTDPSANAHNGIFNTGSDVPGFYTYTVAGTSPCPLASAQVEVIVVTLPDPGANATLDLCLTDPINSLFTVLGGTPDPGGVWTDASGSPFSGNFDPATDPAGVYTYTLSVPPPCVSVTSTVTVTTIAPPNPGVDALITLCISSPLTDLFVLLGGSPDAGGSWNGPGGSMNGNFDPATHPAGVYTYSVLGTSPCLSASATVTVSVVSLPDPGTPGSIDLCETDPINDLFNSLGGTPDVGGSWTDANGDPVSGNFNPATDPAGVYTYTLTVPPPCVSVSSTVSVTVITPPDPGIDALLTLCISSPVTDLFTLLGGSPDTGGSWNGPSGSMNGNFDPSAHVAGIYIYTVLGTTPCPSASATVTVSVVGLPDPGIPGMIDLCETDPTNNLFNSIGGTPDIGGSWTDANGDPFSGNFDPTNDPAGVYTYTLSVPPPCTSVSSTVTVAVIAAPDPGIDGSVTFCVTGGVTDLFPFLGGTPDIAGSWTDPSGNSFGGNFDPSTDSPGYYTYTISGNSPCPNASALVEVIVVTLPNPGVSDSITLCTTDGVADLYTSIGGTPDPGGTWTYPNGSVFSGNFDPANDPNGVYTYTLTVPPPCTSVSSTVTVFLNTPPDPGLDVSLVLCNSGAVLDLYTSLGGTPQIGGSWTDPSGAPFNALFDPNTGAAGIYTYTVQGTAPCPAQSATVSITLIGIPDAGLDDILNLCYIGPQVNLFPALGGSPDAGGTWTDPSGNPTNGTFDPTVSTPGNYTYTVTGTAPCPSTSTIVTVNVLSNPDAGVDGTLTICGNAAAVDLFYSLLGSPDPGGDWYDPSGNLLPGLYDPTTDPAGIYTYILSVPLPCIGDTALVDVTIITPPDPGISDTVTVCQIDTPFDLFSLLGGSPDVGGSWTEPSGNAHSNLFDPASDVAGSYAYTVLGVSPCPDASAFVTVIVEQLPNAGVDGSLTVCPENNAFDLYSILGGTPDTGGVWTDPNAQVFSGIYDPAVDPQGVYTYTVNFTTSCPNGNATATVTIFNVLPPDAGIDSVSCNLSYTFNPSGAWTSGIWSGPAGVSFDDATMANATVTVPQGGAYLFHWDILSPNGCISGDSVNVVFTDSIQPSMLTTDNICWSYCAGEARVSWTGGNMNTTSPHFIWSGGIAGINDSIAYNLCAGQYQVTVADTNGCFANAPFDILEPVELIINQVVSVDETCPGYCDGTIDVVDPLGYLFSYDGGATFTQFPYANNLCAGQYDIIMQDSLGCVTSGVGIVNSPPPVLAGFNSNPDTLLTDNTLAQFFNTSQNAVNYSWDIDGQFAGSNTHLNYTFPNALGDSYEICLNAWDANGCEDSYCYELIVLDVLQLWVPNAFTPDGTGVNETFGPVFNGDWVSEYQFLIFDRWGELIFETDQPGHLWDGAYKGQLVQEGVYVWRVVYKDRHSNKKRDIFGHVSVLR